MCPPGTTSTTEVGRRSQPISDHPRVFLATSVLLKAFSATRKQAPLPAFLTDADAERLTFEKSVYEAYLAFRGIGGKKPDEGRGRWAERNLDPAVDPLSLSRRANRFHGQDVAVAHLWVNLIEGREIEYLEVEPSDVELANRLAHEVLGRSLDELPPQTRRLLELLDGLVAEASEREGVAREEVRFSRREVRRATGWRDTQLRVHLARLVALEYLLVHQGSRGRSYVYSMAFDPGEGGSEIEGEQGAEAGGRAGRYLPGLIDPAALGDRKGKGTTTTSRGKKATSRGKKGKNAPPTRPHRGGVAGSAGEVESPVVSGVSGATSRGGPEITSRGASSGDPSYRIARTGARYSQAARGRG